MTTLREILAHRGRIVVFTPSATLGLKVEQVAERNHAIVICARGQADPYIPVSAWHRVCNARDYGVFSCDQVAWVTGVRLPATDLVWVGETGLERGPDHLAVRYRQAMNRAAGSLDIRTWAIREEDL